MMKTVTLGVHHRSNEQLAAMILRTTPAYETVYLVAPTEAAVIRARALITTLAPVGISTKLGPSLPYELLAAEAPWWKKALHRLQFLESAQARATEPRSCHRPLKRVVEFTQPPRSRTDRAFE